MELAEGDITSQDTDAIVNAANRSYWAAAAWMVRSTGRPARSF